MKRNMDLIRKILFSVEEGTDSGAIDGFDKNTTMYHQALLIEAGLVKGTVTKYLENASEFPSDVYIEKLTWAGHEFIDSVRQDTIWNTIKSEFKDASVETVIKVAKQLAEGFAKKKVEQILGQ